MRARRFVAALLALAGCVPALPEGRYVCASAADCPPGWACVEQVCRSVAALDAGTIDASTIDAATLDAATLDAATTDAGTIDAATLDAGALDAATLDAGAMDAATLDAGALDGGAIDAGVSGDDRVVVDVTAGRKHACARTAAGHVYCWGDNTQRQLGAAPVTMGTRAVSSAVPFPAPFGPAIALCAAGTQSCALDATGAIACWGAGLAPRLLPDAGEVVSIACGGHDMELTAGTAYRLGNAEHHACALDRAGTVACIGQSNRGQAGLATGMATSWTPISVPLGAGETVVELAAGGAHTCARTSAGAVHCWGEGARLQLGVALDAGRTSTPVPVLAVASGASAITAGSLHTCAVVGGAVNCWGDARSGQVGVRSEMPQLPADVATPDLSGTVDLGAGLYHGCARREDGALRCWGSNPYGEVGDGTTCSPSTARVSDGFPSCSSLSSTGVAVTGAAFTATSVAVGEQFACAVRADAMPGTVWCWGNGLTGRLGGVSGARNPSLVTVLP